MVEAAKPLPFISPAGWAVIAVAVLLLGGLAYRSYAAHQRDVACQQLSDAVALAGRSDEARSPGFCERAGIR